MGITDEVKASSSGKSKPPLPSKPSLNAGTNGPGEAAIPQMVITSAEGVAEEIELENVNGTSAGQEIVPCQDTSQHDKEKEIEEKHTARQRPLVISGCDESIVAEESTHQKSTKPIESSTTPLESSTKPLESSTKPLDSSTKPLESSTKPLESSTKPLESSTKPLESSTKPLESTIKPLESTESTSRTAIQRPLIIKNFDTSKEPSDNTNSRLQNLPEVSSNINIGCDEFTEKAVSNYHDDALPLDTIVTTESECETALTAVQRPLIFENYETPRESLENIGPRFEMVQEDAALNYNKELDQPNNNLDFCENVLVSDNKEVLNSAVEHSVKGEFEPAPGHPKVQDEVAKDSDGFFSKAKEFFSHKVGSDDKKTPSSDVEHSAKGELEPIREQPKVQDETTKDGFFSKAKGFQWKPDGKFFSHNVALDDKKASGSDVEHTAKSELEPIREQQKVHDETSKDGFFSKAKGFQWKPDGKFFSHNVTSDDKKSSSSDVDHSAKREFEAILEQPKVQDETTKDGFFSKAKGFQWKPDGKFFSHKVVSDDKKASSSAVENSAKDEFEPIPKQSTLQDETTKDGFFPKTKGFQWKPDGKFFSHKIATDDKKALSSAVENPAKVRFELTPEQPKVQDEITKDSDGFFSKKFFSHKVVPDDKKTVSSAVEHCAKGGFGPIPEQLKAQGEATKDSDGFFSKKIFSHKVASDDKKALSSVVKHSAKDEFKPITEQPKVQDETTKHSDGFFSKKIFSHKVVSDEKKPLSGVVEHSAKDEFKPITGQPKVQDETTKHSDGFFSKKIFSHKVVSDDKKALSSAVEHSAKGEFEPIPEQPKVHDETTKHSDSFFSNKFFSHKVVSDDKKASGSAVEHSAKGEFEPIPEQPKVQDDTTKDSDGFFSKKFFSHKVVSDDKKASSSTVEHSATGEFESTPEQLKFQQETTKHADGFFSKKFFSHKVNTDDKKACSAVEHSAKGEFELISELPKVQDEVSKDEDNLFSKSKDSQRKPDGKFFSFPKLHFGSKEQDESTKEQALDSIEMTSSRPLKVNKKEQKSKTQEYSIETAEALNESAGFIESYKKLDYDDAAPIVPPVILVSDVKSEIKIEEKRSTTEPFAIPKRSKSEEVVKKEKSDKKQQKKQNDHRIEEKGRIEDPFVVPVELQEDKVAQKEKVDKKKQKDHKLEEKKEPKETKNVTPESPDSLYETCCLRLAVLIRNKALDIVSDHTSKISPPKKPPKPTAEAIAKARAAVVAKKFEDTEKHLNFGDQLLAGYDEIRYADDDTESSTDYKDLADLGYIMNPECYGIITKMKSENKMNNFSAPSTCSGMTSYYTAETITLKDGNSSDNTLDTVSLGSGDSVVPLSVVVPLPLEQETKTNLKKKNFFKSIGMSEKSPAVDKKAISQVEEKKSSGMKPFSFFRGGKQEKYFDAQPGPKKIPPPIPPKPTILLRPKESAKNKYTFAESNQSDISSCVNKLSLSPRPLMRSSNNSAGIRKRPLTIAGVKETEFPQFVKKTISDNAQNKPVLNTVLVNKSLKTMRKLPKEPSPVKRSSSFPDKSSTTEMKTNIPTPKKLPPQRPPPPVISPHVQSMPVSVSSDSNIPATIDSSPHKELVTPPRRLAPKIPISPPRPLPPAVKPAIRPSRPPPPVISSPQQQQEKTLETIFTPEGENAPGGSAIIDKSSFVTFEDGNLEREVSYCTDFSQPSSSENIKIDVHHYLIDKDHETQYIATSIDDISIGKRATEHDSRPLNVVDYTSSKKESMSFEPSVSDLNSIPEDDSFNQSSNIFNSPENELSPSESATLNEHFDVCDTKDLTSIINYRDDMIHSPICDTAAIESKANIDTVLDSFEQIPKATPRKPKPRPPPRIRRKRSRTVEIVPVTWIFKDTRRRSQSLTDIDVEKRTASRESFIDHEKPELKALYTTVHKDPIKNKNAHFNTETELERKSPSLEFVSSRPLPAPPPPPRSKSHSASRRSKSDERPSTADTLSEIAAESNIVNEKLNTIDHSKLQIKPPIRRRKENKRRFLSLGSEDQQKNPQPLEPISFSLDRKIKTKQRDNFLNDKAPIKPERRAKVVQAEIHFDENANIADPVAGHLYSNSADYNKGVAFSRQRTHSADCNANPKDFPDKKKASPLQRSKSESVHPKSDGVCQKSHSSWYDESEASGALGDVNTKPCSSKESLEKLDSHPDIIEQGSQGISYSKQKQIKAKVDNAKKPRQTSKFYVDVDFPEVLEDTDSISIHSGKEDKETSPLPLECSEKSVQTSLETLSRGVTSQGEQSDDTDELLDLAQTLQDELKTIINRHKRGEQNESESDDTRSQDKSFLPSHLKDSKLHGSRSSTSEIWQMTSSDDSDPELGLQKETNLTELAIARKKKKIFYIAQEIMTSEEAFVDALKLLNVDFKAAVENASKQRGAPVVPDEVLNQILNHLPQLQHLNDNLLQELKDRIDQWDKNNKIADIIVKMGPFLKLYSWYIQDFEATTTLLEETKKKYPSFWQVVKEFEVSSRCKRLTLNHYMLKPVQRIPQYRLLLQEYLHQLPEDSADYENTIEALRIVSDVAKHANDSMKQGDNFQKLISIQSSILGQKEIIKPGRMFIKEGELMKLSRKGMQPRWFVLLNDLLLYLTPVQQGLYRINHELILVGMKVAIPIQQDYQNEFSIISVTRSFTLAAKSPEERQEWIVALTKSIEDNASKRSTFTNVRLQQKSQLIAEDYDDGAFVLGKKAPVWIPDARVTMCQLCTSEFTVTFRRHHCRACGKVVCSICSSNRISLQYLGNRIARVCDECYTKLGQGSTGCTESGETDSDNQQIAIKSHLRTDHKHNRKLKRQLPSVLKEVCANDQGSSISGYVQKKANKSWKRNWFVVKDKVLYEYKASEDVAALRSIPLLGYQIETFTEPLEGVDQSLLFQVSHPGQAPVIFHAETPGSAERWIKALKEATVLE